MKIIDANLSSYKSNSGTTQTRQPIPCARSSSECNSLQTVVLSIFYLPQDSKKSKTLWRGGSSRMCNHCVLRTSGHPGKDTIRSAPRIPASIQSSVRNAVHVPTPHMFSSSVVASIWNVHLSTLRCLFVLCPPPIFTSQQASLQLELPTTLRSDQAGRLQISYCILYCLSVLGHAGMGLTFFHTLSLK